MLAVMSSSLWLLAASLINILQFVAAAPATPLLAPVADAPKIMDVYRQIYGYGLQIDVDPVGDEYHETWDLTLAIFPNHNVFLEFHCRLVDFPEPPAPPAGQTLNVPLTCDTPGPADGYSVWLQSFAPLRAQVDKQQPAGTNRNFTILIHNPAFMSKTVGLSLGMSDTFSSPGMTCNNNGVPGYTCTLKKNSPMMSVSVIIDPSQNPQNAVNGTIFESFAAETGTRIGIPPTS